MSINTKLHTDVNQFSPGEFVILYELNMTSVGGTTSYFVEDTTSSGTVVYLMDKLMHLLIVRQRVLK